MAVVSDRLRNVSLLVALTLAACGDDSAGGTSDGDTDPEDTAGDAVDGSGGDDATDAESDGEDAASDGDDAGGTQAIGEACDTDRDCISEVCFQVGTGGSGGFCSQLCNTSANCPEGNWQCAFVVNSGGDAARICVSPDLCIDPDEDGFGIGDGCDGIDCDEDSPLVNPAAAEVCDDVDNDCDGRVDDFPVDTGDECDTGLAGECAQGRSACLAGVRICEVQRTASSEICDGLDNDCDGEIDLGDEGSPLTETCYGGPEETDGVGACQPGLRTCLDGRLGGCVGQVLPFVELCNEIDDDCDGVVDDGDPQTGVACDTGLPGVCGRGLTVCGGADGGCRQLVEPSDELCDGFDNDCDGLTDESADGSLLARDCYEGEPATLGVGPCVGGQQFCVAGDFGPCVGDVGPSAELCDGIDNDCSGIADNDAVGGGSCATGLSGVCAIGTLTCDEEGSTGCEPLIAAVAETCDALDNDCDGQIDEGAVDGEALVRSCYAGPDGTLGVGVCQSGNEICTIGSFSSCQGQVTPRIEVCNGLDDDCDGVVDDGNPEGGVACDSGLDGACRTGRTVCSDGELVCDRFTDPVAERCNGVDDDCDGETDEFAAGVALTRVCYDGDPGLIGVGVCTEGVQTCAGGEFGGCVGDVTPTVEVCNAADDDCDGQIDDNAVGGGSCATGLPGVCAIGLIDCGDDGGTCFPLVEPSSESCDGLDNDCDGGVDENALDAPIERACYTGPLGTLGVGICSQGFETCAGGSFSSCAAQITPRIETCNGLDDDCDGVVDDGNPGGGDACDTEALGSCRAGRTVCTEGGLECQQTILPADERCNGLDDDCDGEADEQEAGVPIGRVCFEGDPAQLGIGVCQAGSQQCVGGEFGACIGDITSTAELCNGADDDCDGTIDDGAIGGGSCLTGRPGVCAIGTANCNGGVATGCEPIIPSSPEVCDGLDNDCDGLTDEDAFGDPLSFSCYDGPADTEDIGICTGGTSTCVAGVYSSCQGQRLPLFELCDGLDNDCDGLQDDGNPEGGYRCDTTAEGLCAPGLTTCFAGEVECLSLFDPEPEVCDGYDNDCDGFSDEGESDAPLARSCYDGAPGTLGVSGCRGGTQTCSRGEYGTCVGQVVPVDEVCDLRDNDCDNTIDEGVTRPFYLDADLDGYGDPETIVEACQVAGYVTNGLDCYDLNAQANPEQAGAFAAHRGDGSWDYNCDGIEESALGGYGSCSSDPPLCYLLTQGWAAPGPIPDCGQSGTYIFDCLGNGNNCDPTTAITQQRCR